ncbi:TPA: hypothetical protein DCR49_06745 [Candidatus Delongbacteria bacterium]|nr:MAG: hypothetical protein A2Y39_01520 [Candidatus Delongbacteria bacterium GWF2_40_14]HAQ61683.1 hypothetical protein [Candidatus Delongbacteria bacterium]
MRKFILTSALMIFTFLSAYDVEKMIASLDQKALYPNATAVNIFTEVTYDINEDYTSEHKVFYLKKILDYSGKIRYSDVEIEYNPDYETVELISYFSVSPENVRIPVPENQVYDLNTDDAVWSPEYVHNRKKIINYPQIGPGYYIALEYKIKSTRKIPASGIEHFQESNPYLEKIMNINYPKKLNCRFDAHSSLSFSKKETDGRIHLSWSVKNSPLIKEEPWSPDYMYSGKPVLFSFFKDWKEFNKDQFSKVFPRSGSKEVKELSNKITADLKTDKEKVFAIYDHLAKNFTAKTSYIAAMDFTPEDLTKTIERKFGSSRDLTALFLALSDAAGIKNCEPAIKLSPEIRLIKNKMKDLVLYDAFDEFLIHYNGTLLEPGNVHQAYGYAGRNNCTVILPSTTGPQDIIMPDKKTVSRKYKYNAAGNDLTIGLETTYSGGYDSWMRSFESFPESERGMRFFQWVIRDNTAELIEGPIFTNFGKLNEDMIISYKIKKPSAVMTQGEHSYFYLSDAFANFDVSLPQRENDFYVSDRMIYTDEFEIAAGKDQEIINLENKDLKFKIGKETASIKFLVKRQNDKIIITRDLYIPEMLIPKDRYQEFRDFIMVLKKPLNSMVFFKKI